MINGAELSPDIASDSGKSHHLHLIGIFGPQLQVMEFPGQPIQGTTSLRAREIYQPFAIYLEILDFITFGNLTFGFGFEVFGVLCEGHPPPLEYAPAGFFVAFPPAGITLDVLVSPQGHVPIGTVETAYSLIEVPALLHSLPGTCWARPAGRGELNPFRGIRPGREVSMAA